MVRAHGVPAHDGMVAVHVRPAVVLGEDSELFDVKGVGPEVQEPVGPVGALDEEITDVHAPTARGDHEVHLGEFVARWGLPSGGAAAGLVDHLVQHNVARHAFGRQDVVPEAQGLVHDDNVNVHPPQPVDIGVSDEGFLQHGDFVPVYRLAVGQVVGGDVGPHGLVPVAVGVCHAVLVDHFLQLRYAEEAACPRGGRDHEDFAGVRAFSRRARG